MPVRKESVIENEMSHISNNLLVHLGRQTGPELMMGQGWTGSRFSQECLSVYSFCHLLNLILMSIPQIWTQESPNFFVIFSNVTKFSPLLAIYLENWEEVAKPCFLVMLELVSDPNKISESFCLLISPESMTSWKPPLCPQLHSPSIFLQSHSLPFFIL